MTAAVAKVYADPKGSCALHFASRLRNHLVRALPHRLRNCDPERPSDFEVDQQIELGRLLDREVGRLRPMQDSVNEVGASAVLLGLCGRVSKQRSCLTDVVGIFGDCRQTVLQRGAPYFEQVTIEKPSVRNTSA